ncbi:D-ribose transporter ATP-binding protein [Spirochaetia bacterium]|nr:D-ribose transporter ATP-binding protein [Spirochaetia bacterium]
MAEPVLQVKKISKNFPGVNALAGISIDFFAGEGHGLVGENGAGKSTLVKIISGIYEPNEGTIVLDGVPKNFKNPREARDNGISVIHQELSIANHLTVAENIFLGMEPRIGKNGMLLNRNKMHKDAQEVLDTMGVNMKATWLAGGLSAAQQQIIEIAKVIVKNSKLVIMDEPTSSLSDKEIATLFDQIKILKQKNVAIIYITHRMAELPIVCDRVTVMRDGRMVKSSRLSETTEKEIVSNMVGREISDYYNRQMHSRGKEMLRVEGLAAEKIFNDVSFSAYEGEILGIAGLVGAGRTEILETIFAARTKSTGKIFLEGKEVFFKSPKDAIRNHVGFVTEDRRRTGLMLRTQIMDNVLLPSLVRSGVQLGPLLLFNRKWGEIESIKYFDRLRIKAPGINTIVSQLSGGNQQKVILAKWLVAQSRVLLLDEPTRGIDVNAKSEFYTLMNEFVNQGGCIVMVSSELPEVIGVSDRILVMREGRISGELEQKDATEQKIIMLASVHSGAA